jgi:hypothetical protein
MAGPAVPAAPEHVGVLGVVRMPLRAVLLPPVLLADSTASDVLRTRSRHQVIWTDTGTMAAAGTPTARQVVVVALVVEIEPFRDGPDKQFVDESMGLARPARDRNATVALWVTEARPKPAAVTGFVLAGDALQ